MDLYHLLFDDFGHAFVVENHPEAIDRVPYDQIAKRVAMMVDAGLADLVLIQCGGRAIYRDQEAIVSAA